MKIRERNEKVRSLRDTIEQNFDVVRKLVVEDEKEFGPISPDAKPEEIAERQKRLHEQAKNVAGYMYPTYFRVKIQSVVKEFGSAVCRICDYPLDSNHAYFVRSLLYAWAEETGLFDQSPNYEQLQREFLGAFDVQYRIRRLRFLIAGVNWLYEALASKKATDGPPPSRKELDAAKSALYDLVGRFERLASGAALPSTLRQQVRNTFADRRVEASGKSSNWDGTECLGEYKSELDDLRKQLRPLLRQGLDELGRDLFESFVNLTANWSPQLRTDMLVRYFGFSFWDAVIYPVYAIAGLTERDEVKVLRMSPDETTVLASRGANEPLKGNGMHHFAAFFKRAWREHDYLRGRLDGAEMIMRMLLDEPNSTRTQEAWESILKEESDLRTTADLVDKVRETMRATWPDRN